MSVVEYALQDHVARITLNRPDKLNAFNDALVDGLSDALDRAVAESARLAVFSANGKGFSGGFDLGDIADASDGDLLMRFVRVEELLQSVFHAPLATVSLVHGPCYGAAADLAAACHWRIATPDARFRMPGPRFGIILGTRRLTNMVGADKARQLLLREKPFKADEALNTGFITEIADQADWPGIVGRIHDDVTALDAATYRRLTDRQRSDTRDSDLAELVRSASAGSVKSRILAYLDQMAAATNS